MRTKRERVSRLKKRLDNFMVAYRAKNGIYWQSLTGQVFSEQESLLSHSGQRPGERGNVEAKLEQCVALHICGEVHWRNSSGSRYATHVFVAE
jgi:hypothetical protein